MAEFTIDDPNYNPSVNFTSQGLTYYTYTDPVLTVNATDEIKRFAIMLEGDDYYTRETFTFEIQEQLKKAISLGMGGRVHKDDGKGSEGKWETGREEGGKARAIAGALERHSMGAGGPEGGFGQRSPIYTFFPYSDHRDDRDDGGYLLL